MDSGKARSRRVGGGLPVFHRKTGFSEYLRCKYSDSPRPSGTPLINAGGKEIAFLDSLTAPGDRRGFCQGLRISAIVAICSSVRGQDAVRLTIRSSQQMCQRSRRSFCAWRAYSAPKASAWTATSPPVR